MTKEDIYRMAQEAGFMTLCINEDTWIPYLSRFATLVAAAEREECAKLCEMVEDDDLYFGSQYALAIRERGAP
jgi:hypothetical protein